MSINEDNFIKYLSNKNEKALDYIIDTYGGLIKSIVNKHLYNLTIYHDECINDILLAIWNGIDKYDNQKGEFKNWLAAICKYKCIYYQRKYLNSTLIEENIESIEFKSTDNIKENFEKRELEDETTGSVLRCKKIFRNEIHKHFHNRIHSKNKNRC